MPYAEYTDKVLRDPRVMMAAALNRQGLLASPWPGDRMGEAELEYGVNGTAVDVNTVSLDQLTKLENLNRLACALAARAKENDAAGYFKGSAFLGVLSVFTAAVASPEHLGGPAILGVGSLVMGSKGFRKLNTSFDMACAQEIAEMNLGIIEERTWVTTKCDLG